MRVRFTHTRARPLLTFAYALRLSAVKRQNFCALYSRAMKIEFLHVADLYVLYIEADILFLIIVHYRVAPVVRVS